MEEADPSTIDLAIDELQRYKLAVDSAVVSESESARTLIESRGHSVMLRVEIQAGSLSREFYTLFDEVADDRSFRLTFHHFPLLSA